MSEHYDVAIVGAGMAGSALACLLGAIDIPRPLRVALIEARALPATAPLIEVGINDFDNRVSALTPASVAILERIGIWESICAQRVSPFRNMRVWDAEGTGEISFSANDVRADALGYIVENRQTTFALASELRQCSHIDVLEGRPVESLLHDEQGGVSGLVMQGGRTLACDLLVAADGAMSAIRNMAGMATRKWDYGQSAIVCTVRLASDHRQTAWQRFMPSGPLALLPLPALEDGTQSLCSLVWSQQREESERLMALDDGEFMAALSSASEYRLGDVVEISRRFSFPLRQCHAVDYVQGGLALVADAAHSIHPLAGQGINLGFADVESLAECLRAAHERGAPLGDKSVLQRYQRQRKGHNLAMIGAVEGFKRLFEQTPLPLRWLRNMSMSGLDRQTRLKNLIVRYAMGVS